MLTIGIVAHTSRKTQATTLADQIHADYLSIDNGTLGCDDNHDHVLTHLAALPSTWSVVLEDDAQPIPDFRNQLKQALTLAPAPIVSLYLGKARPTWAQSAIAHAIPQADNTNADWIVGTKLFHAVGYAIRTELLNSYLNFNSQLPVDQHITFWAQQYGYTVAYTWPSLVDHADQPTLVDHPDGQPRPAGRKAWRTGTHQRWTTQAVTM